MPLRNFRSASYRWELCLVTAFIIICIAIDLRLETHLERDSHLYLELGHRFLNEGHFAYEAPDGQVRPDLARTPGYPTLVAGILALCNGNAQVAIPVLIWLQRLAWAAAVCFTLPRIINASGRRRNYCLLGKLVLLFSPLTLLYGSLLLTDLIYAAGLLVGLRYLVTTLARPAPHRAVAAGIGHGLLTLIRPIHLFAPIALALPWLRVRFGTSLFILLISMGIPLTWVIRNHAVGDAWVLSSITGRGLALHQLPALKIMPMPPGADDPTHIYLRGVQTPTGTPFTASWTLMHQLSMPETEVDSVARSLAIKSIVQNPASYLVQTLHNLRRLVWSPAEGQAIARHLGLPGATSIIGTLAAASSALFIFLLPAALILLRLPYRIRASRTARSYFLTAAYLMIIPALTTVTYGRFALPILPLVGFIYCYSDTGARRHHKRQKFGKRKA